MKDTLNFDDDVAGLLVPFIREISPKVTAAFIEEKCLEASLGNLSADEFWASLGIDSSVKFAELSDIVAGLADSVGSQLSDV